MTIHSAHEDNTRYEVHENEKRQDFNIIFKKTSIMKYMSGKIVTGSHKMQNYKGAF